MVLMLKVVTISLNLSFEISLVRKPSCILHARAGGGSA